MILGNHTLTIGDFEIPLNPQLSFSKSVWKPAVPEDYIFVIGDNPSESVDSRTFGFVPVSNVTGKVIGF